MFQTIGRVYCPIEQNQRGQFEVTEELLKIGLRIKTCHDLENSRHLEKPKSQKTPIIDREIIDAPALKRELIW